VTAGWLDGVLLIPNMSKSSSSVAGLLASELPLEKPVSQGDEDEAMGAAGVVVLQGSLATAVETTIFVGQFVNNKELRLRSVLNAGQVPKLTDTVFS